MARDATEVRVPSQAWTARQWPGHGFRTIFVRPECAAPV